ncbi:hypothetical protein V8V75_23815 [Peribacillus frigoritolerans]
MKEVKFVKTTASKIESSTLPLLTWLTTSYDIPLKKSNVSQG